MENNSLSVLKYPLTTEKNVKLMQNENKLVFVVDRRATKPEIKKDRETRLILPNGKKKAYLRLSPETPALDVATQLGLI